MERRSIGYVIEFGPGKWATLCAGSIQLVFGIKSKWIKVTVSKVPFKGSKRFGLLTGKSFLSVYRKDFNSYLSGSTYDTIHHDFGPVKQLYVRIVPCKPT